MSCNVLAVYDETMRVLRLIDGGDDLLQRAKVIRATTTN